MRSAATERMWDVGADRGLGRTFRVPSDTGVAVITMKVGEHYAQLCGKGCKGITSHVIKKYRWYDKFSSQCRVCLGTEEFDPTKILRWSTEERTYVKIATTRND